MNKSTKKVAKQELQQSLWIVNQPQPYEIPKLLVDKEIQNVLESIRNTEEKEIEIELKFKGQSDLQKFMKLYHQQIFQEQYDYTNNEDTKQESKFKKIKDIDQKDYEVRQLAFPSHHFVTIFMKIYQTRLKQIQIEYQYRFFIHRNKFRVYFPKGTKISSFFKNQIFEMKTKLILFYSNDQTVIDKIKYSSYFNSLIEKKSIAAEYHKRLNGANVAIFYSNIHNKKSIIEIINKNLLQHMTLLDFLDNRLKISTNQTIFKLLYSLLSDKIKVIKNQNDVIIQPNYEKCCILVHDKHECFVDAKNQIMEAIENIIAFKLDGNDMRTIFNKVIRNHKKYSYLRVKYSHRSLYCVLDTFLLNSTLKNIMSFVQLLHEYFKSYMPYNYRTKNEDEAESTKSKQDRQKTFGMKTAITLYMKFSKYPDFLNFFFKISADKNIWIINFNEFTMNEGYEMSKIMLGVKETGQLNVSKTRKQFFEMFLQIILKKEKINQILQNFPGTFDNVQGILGFKDPSQCSTLLSESMSQQINKSKDQSNFNEQKQKLTQEKIEQALSSEKQLQSVQNVPELVSRTSFSQRYKQREKKPKHIEITYDFKMPQIDQSLKTFWSNNTRQSKLQRILLKHNQFFGNLKFKTFKLTLKQKIECPAIQDLEKERIYISTILEKNNQLFHHFVDLHQLSKICLSTQSKDKTFFIFYKYKDQQLYIPCYTIVLL